jgi:hypothetical protein
MSDSGIGTDMAKEPMGEEMGPNLAKIEGRPGTKDMEVPGKSV